MPPPPDSEAILEETRLLARSGAGDRDAFRALYERYRTPLFSLAVRLVGNTGEAEELLQDSFVKIWKHAGAHDPRKSRPFTWAVTIVRRTCIDHLRKRKIRPSSTPFLEEMMPVQADTGLTAAEAHEDAQRLKGALAGIAPSPRRALELALFSEMTQAEIARRLEQPVGTIKSWIRRGMLALRTTLEEPTP